MRRYAASLLALAAALFMGWRAWWVPNDLVLAHNLRGAAAVRIVFHADEHPAPLSDTPGPSGLSEADTVAIYAAVIRSLCFAGDSLGSQCGAPTLYLLRTTDDRGGNPLGAPSPPSAIPEAVQQGLAAALSDLPVRLVWVDTWAGVPLEEGAGKAVAGHGAAITLGNIRLRQDGAALVPAGVYIASLSGRGQTYVIEKAGGTWEVTGNTGYQWVS